MAECYCPFQDFRELSGNTMMLLVGLNIVVYSFKNCCKSGHKNYIRVIGVAKMSYIIRSIEVTDEPFLWEMLYQALYVPPKGDSLARDVIFQPELAKYVQNWGLHES